MEKGTILNKLDNKEIYWTVLLKRFENNPKIKENFFKILKNNSSIQNLDKSNNTNEYLKYNNAIEEAKKYEKTNKSKLLDKIKSNIKEEDINKIIKLKNIIETNNQKLKNTNNIKEISKLSNGILENFTKLYNLIKTKINESMTKTNKKYLSFSKEEIQNFAKELMDELESTQSSVNKSFEMDM